MLSQRDNDTLCRVGPGTPMGELFRRFWLPAMLSSVLPEPDCAPVRLKLLGENLVAFRDSEGRAGVRQGDLYHVRAIDVVTEEYTLPGVLERHADIATATV